MPTNDSGSESPGRVLVVDDDELVRIAIERGLKRLGYEVTHAADGQEGLEKLAAARPQVVFLDLRMPGIDGHTFLRRLAGSAIMPAVVVVSGQGDMDDVVDVLRAGAVDYLRKPWVPAELLAAVTRGFEAFERRSAGAPPDTAAHAGVPGPSSAQGNSTPRSLRDILDQIKAGDIRLPCVPSVITELRRLMAQPETALKDVVAHLERDAQLAAEVLRLSNSAYYARNGRNSDLRTAVSRIGFRQTYTLVETIFASGLWRVSDQTARRMLTSIWRRSLAQGLAMRAVTDMIAVRGELSSDTAYLIGLFADAGASFLVWVASQVSAPLPSPDSLKSTIQETHAEIGALILQRWQFGATVSAAVRAHHSSTPGAGSNPYWPVVVVGSDLADELVSDDPTAREPLDRSLVGSRAAELGVSGPLRSRLLIELKKEFEELARSWQ